MCRLTLSFKQLVSLVKTEIPDKQNEFEQMFISILHRKSNLMTMRIPAPAEYASSLLETVQALKFDWSPTILKLVSDFHDVSAFFIIPPGKRDQIPPSSQQTKQIIIPKPGTLKAPVAKVNSTSLSLKKQKKFRKCITDIELKNEKFYTSCTNGSSCKVCPELVRKAPLSPCTHPNPHDGGYFPHLARKIVRKVHQFKDYTIVRSIAGTPNPFLAAEASNTGATKPTDMETDCSAKSAVSVAGGAKKRKLPSSEKEFEWMKHLLNTHSDMAMLRKVLEIAKSVEAPSKIVSGLQKWFSLTAEEKEEIFN